MRATRFLLLGLSLACACADPVSDRLIAARQPIDGAVDSLPSAEDAAAFVVESAGILTGMSDRDDAFRTFELAGGAGARGAIQPPVDSLPEQLCMNPRDPELYERQHRGLTYVWDPEQASYVYSTEHESRGCDIRIDMYALDNSGMPADPLARTGYIDIGDLYSPGPMIGVRFTVVRDTGTEDTITQYSSTRNYQYYTRAYDETWRLVGFFERDGERFDFVFHQFTSAGTISGESYNNVSGSSSFVGGGVELTTSLTPTSYTITVRREDRSVEFHMERASVDVPFAGHVRTIGAWSHEGIVAVVTGSRLAPVFRDTLGGALPGEVDDQLHDFWSSMLDHFGLHRWPHV